MTPAEAEAEATPDSRRQQRRQPTAAAAAKAKMGTEAPARLVPVCQRNSRSTTETTQWVNSAEERKCAVGAVRGSLSLTHTDAGCYQLPK